MRPTRLELEGFTAFRDPVVVDFDGADLFALTGSTGSGKSSLIDAIVFALYGSVPRLDDRRAVEPVISAQSREARVRLDFTADGEHYTAVRVVRREARGGATTKEARLERRGDGEVLAGTADEVSAEVEGLLGLGFDHFTKCVVLPQGQFQRLLHDKPGDRQKLLVTLLDLGLYKVMAQAAGRREQQARAQAEIAEALLADRAASTPERHDEVAAHVSVLEGLRAEVAAARPRLDSLHSAELAARGHRAEADAWVERLGGVVVPDGLADRGMLLVEARHAVKLAEADEHEAAALVEAAEDAVEALPARSQLETARRWHDERATSSGRHGDLDALALRARCEEEAAASERRRAEAVAAEASSALERAQWEHRAHDLRASLELGEPCPVCVQPVAELPGLVAAGAVEEARAAKASAEGGLRAAGEQLGETQQRRSRAEADLASVEDRLAELDAVLAGEPSRDAVLADLERLGTAEEALTVGRTSEGTARKAATSARAKAEELRQLEGSDRRRFAEARDGVAALGPPPVGQDDLVADWEALASWASRERAARSKAAIEAAELVQEAARERAELAAELVDRLGAAGVSVRAEPGDAVNEALAEAKASLAQIGRDLALAAEHRATAERHRQEAALAQELARHLSASRFEKWVLDEALALLVEGATEILLELSSGTYSLDQDDRANFVVIDHRNADERRSARTLSGGETFLASLALALALADQLSRLAARGAARLDSIFLDEGFGALDAETLDTVAAAIEELGSRGRTVGLVSHVAELAERVPVRFVVTKGPTTSTVERIEQ